MKLPLQADLGGRLVRRYKRFFADVETDDGRTLTVHCPNPGSMLGVSTPGAEVRCSTSENAKRRFPHTLEMIRVGRAWVGLHTTRANHVVEAALAAGALPGLEGYATVRREPRLADGSRHDFLLTQHASDERPAYVEVKSATLADGSRARFPDSVTERGRRHLESLAALHKEGARAVMLFVVQRADCEALEPADDIDPAYGRALREAAALGVEVAAVRVRVSPSCLALEESVPVLL